MSSMPRERTRVVRASELAREDRAYHELAHLQACGYDLGVILGAGQLLVRGENAEHVERVRCAIEADAVAMFEGNVTRDIARDGAPSPAQLLAGVTYERTESARRAGFPPLVVDVRLSSLEEAAVAHVHRLRSTRDCRLSRYHADAIAATLEALLQRDAQPVRAAPRCIPRREDDTDGRD